MYTLSKIIVYPIKSLGGFFKSTSVVEVCGLQYDRRWMLVDLKGKFMSLRTTKEMVFLKAEVLADLLIITDSRTKLNFSIPVGIYSDQKMKVTVWDDTFEANLVSDEADAWFSSALGVSCKLVYMTDDSLRLVDPKYAVDPVNQTSFSDAYPILIIGQSSMNLISEKLGEPVSEIRFRPNLIFEGAEPHAEDQWTRFKIGNLEMAGVKLCKRCQVPGMDPETGENHKKLLKTLSQYRLKENHIIFGQNVIPVGLGEIKIGDSIVVL
jgi:uncharacterized protein